LKIIITGHNGFIGTRLVKQLIDQGHEVHGLSRTDGNDITNRETFSRLGHFDTLIHLAAQSFVPLSFKEPYLFYHDNYLGTLNCLEACRLNDAKMIFLSSYVYGQPVSLPVSEDHPIQPSNPYMSSKHLCEQLCLAYLRDFTLRLSIVRPFNVYGEGQSDNFLIPTIINQLPKGEIRLQDPRPKRDFIHVDDLADAIVKMVRTDKGGGIYNIGSGESVSIGEIIDILEKEGLISRDKVFFSNEQRQNEVLETKADISKARSELEWEPRKNFHEQIISIAKNKLKEQFAS
jgi:nucleoside-diphosphate-sugar epimerase